MVVLNDLLSGMILQVAAVISSHSRKFNPYFFLGGWLQYLPWEPTFSAGSSVGLISPFIFSVSNFFGNHHGFMVLGSKGGGSNILEWWFQGCFLFFTPILGEFASIFFKWVGSMTSLYTVDASAIPRENPAEAVVITGVYTYDV